MIKEEIVDSYRDLIRELGSEIVDDRINSIDQTVRLFESRIATQERITDDFARKLDVDVIIKKIEDFEKRIVELELNVSRAVKNADKRITEMFESIEDQRLGLLEHRVDDLENHLGV